jgi:hypothetical protein
VVSGPGGPLADAKRKALAVAHWNRVVEALDGMGSVVGASVYGKARETLVVRAGMWIDRGDCAAADLIAAAEYLTTPAALASIGAEWDLNPAFARAVMVCRAERIAREQKEREEAERKRWEEEFENPANRAVVLKLLAGIATQVGRGRPTTTPTVKRGEDQDEGQTPEQVAAGEEGGTARRKAGG